MARTILKKNSRGEFKIEHIPGALAAQTDVITENMSGQHAAQTMEIHEDMVDQLAGQTKELEAAMAAGTQEATQVTHQRADKIDKKLDNLEAETKKKNVKYVRKPWFWALEIVIFAVIAFVMYFFTQNIAMLPQLSEDALSVSMVFNPARWISIFCVALVPPVLLTMTDIAMVPVKDDED